MALVKRVLQSSKFIWAIFGNDEDPDPPDWFMPEKNENLREFTWFFIRNPLHNFCARFVQSFGFAFKLKEK